jgi:hypothetical protein
MRLSKLKAGMIIVPKKGERQLYRVVDINKIHDTMTLDILFAKPHDQRILVSYRYMKREIKKAYKAEQVIYG